MIGFGLTNATKAVVAGVVSAGLNLVVLFGVDLSGEQVAGANAFADAVLIAWVALSYQDSPARVPEFS